MICLKKKSVGIAKSGSNRSAKDRSLKFASSSSSKEVKGMNKMMTSMIAFGAGMAAYNLAQRNNMMSARKMKRVQRKVKRAIF
jgi:hypothetical protein